MLAPWPRSQAALQLEAEIEPALRRYVVGYPGYADVPQEHWPRRQPSSDDDGAVTRIMCKL